VTQEGEKSPVALVVTTFLTVLGGTVLIPAVRPFFAAMHPGDEGALHAFMSVNMVGGALCAPLVAYVADKTHTRRPLAVSLLALDGFLMAAVAFVPSLAFVLVLRVVQGGASVGGLSIVMGALGSRIAGREKHDASLGWAGAAVVAAIACGAPIGALCVKQGPRAALFASAAFSGIAALLAAVSLRSRERATVRAPLSGLDASSRNELRIAAFFVAIERLGVGSFVVTFSLYAHRALAKSDAQIGMLYTLFLVPFAVTSALAPRLAAAIPRAYLLVPSGIIYGACIAGLGQTSGVVLSFVLVLAGVVSGLIYSPALYIAASSVPKTLRATAMGFTNAAGTLGMMVGTAIGGVALSFMLAGGADPTDAYRLVFIGAGALVSLCFAASSIWLRARRCHPQRLDVMMP
jgi:MFS family permease